MGELLIGVNVGIDEGDCGLPKGEGARPQQGHEHCKRAGAAGERESCGRSGTVHE